MHAPEAQRQPAGTPHYQQQHSQHTATCEDHDGDNGGTQDTSSIDNTNPFQQQLLARVEEDASKDGHQKAPTSLAITEHLSLPEAPQHTSTTPRESQTSEASQECTSLPASKSCGSTQYHYGNVQPMVRFADWLTELHRSYLHTLKVTEELSDRHVMWEHMCDTGGGTFAHMYELIRDSECKLEDSLAKLEWTATCLLRSYNTSSWRLYDERHQGVLAAMDVLQHHGVFDGFGPMSPKAEAAAFRPPLYQEQANACVAAALSILQYRGLLNAGCHNDTALMDLARECKSETQVEVGYLTISPALTAWRQVSCIVFLSAGINSRDTQSIHVCKSASWYISYQLSGCCIQCSHE